MKINYSILFHVPISDEQFTERFKVANKYFYSWLSNITQNKNKCFLD